MHATTTERTADEIRAELETYEQARPQLARDLEQAARMVEEERKRLIRGAGSLSARSRATADHAAAVTGLEDVDRRVAALRAGLAEAEARARYAAGRAGLAAMLSDASAAREDFEDAFAVLVNTLARRVPQTVDAYERWVAEREAIHAEAVGVAGDDRAAARLLRELEADGHDLGGAWPDPAMALRQMDRPPLERVVLKLLEAERTRRQHDRSQLPRRRVAAPPVHPDGAYAILTQRAGEGEAE